ncbi:hypothetical protein OF829_11090 [Sphingomonas sp. LB-2]|uniref:hypothetical protein n=1 Tax=Sphingomonas caeni TaxID=2984949 RepID=UPI002232BC05|nr:hypothetical protein [Sphingomonas caeni]MCW3847787.1 hypothetical protein [Sphingomonas caeni]
MVAKGVDFWLYSDQWGRRIDVHAPAIKYTNKQNFRPDNPGNLQISSKNIPGFTNYTGRLEFIVHRNNGREFVEIFRKHEDISSYTGNLQGGPMSNMFNTPPMLGPYLDVSWGLFDAGSTQHGLRNQHRLYVYVTQPHRRWMERLTGHNRQTATAPFSRWVLPGSHDAGMFDMRAVRKILSSAALSKALIGTIQVVPILGPIILALGGNKMIARALANLAMTQKDDIRTQLDIGIRYFDFRPGIMHPALRAFTPNVRYHQHGMIPGCPYIEFLEEVLKWLAHNDREIVVVSANTQGFSAEAMEPSAADLRNDLQAAREKTGVRDIKDGTRADLDRSYDELIRSKTRLIFLNQIEGETRKYDSYNGGYASVHPDNIIYAFERIQREMPAGMDYVVMQMQLTATGATGVLGPAIFTRSDASSPLLGTKPDADNITNPWLRRNLTRLPRNHLIVLLNDFVDNCMVDTAIDMTDRRNGGPVIR